VRKLNCKLSHKIELWSILLEPAGVLEAGNSEELRDDIDATPDRALNPLQVSNGPK
jgi:hypothetical protein